MLKAGELSQPKRNNSLISELKMPEAKDRYI